MVLVALFYPNQFPMANFHLLLHLAALLLLCIFQFTNSETMETQALLEFKKQLKDPLNRLESWNENQSPCLFVGITCDSESNNVVIGISLINMSLSGHLSASLAGLQSLTSLELQTNSISGTIPSELANCTNLQFLNLSSNSFTGQLPDLSSLQKLRALDLSTNQLYGSFPTWVGKLSGLVHLGLAQNNFEGEIPQGIGNLRNLTWLYLAQCNLTGEIPSSIFGLSSLGTLDLSQNKVSGKLPNGISKLRSVWKIELYQNKLTGEIPAEVATLTHLREFDISSNQMNGKIPPEIGNMNFTVFQIYQNNFSGELPEGFGNMQHLKSFSIYGNNFSGEFPASLGRYSPLTSFDISENSFSGPFPRFLCQSNNLQYLLALDNKFSGEFPDSYANCKPLLRFRISQNFFTGKVPDGLWGLPFAVIIDVADNAFIGGISSDIGISTSLTQLYVQNNKFSAALPAEIGKPSQLQKIFAYNNSFSGQVPSQIGDLNQLTSLHLEMNSLTGSIPPEIGMCSSLVDLDLAHNSLNGEIPGKIASLASLNSLNLSNNMLIGSIPEGLQFLKLSSIDLSQNQLSGRVPSQLLMIAGDGAFAGNPGLCIDENTGSCNLSRGHKGVFGRRMDLILIIMLTLFILLAGIAFVSYKSFKIEESCRKVDIEDGMDDYSECKLDAFYPTELDAQEICNLEEQNLIGSGGTGKVYRLDLNKNRGTFAVKQLWNGKDAKVVMSEISIMGKIRHRNILKLCACLTRGESSYLVFEYMPNGNLYQGLHREIKAGKSELDWNRRYNIALGAAKGIMYLHHDCSPAIVHRDIKSTNILLDEEYEAKIADFGIAKVAEDSDNSCFAGTHGYMAPELAYSLKVTEKSDVYSFGVVLLELLTGRSPVTPQFGEGKDIVYWVSTHLEAQKVQDIFDPRVSKFAADDMIKVLKIAILCTTKLPSLRPSMREVVNMLIKADPCLVDNRGKHFAKNCKIF